jgi:hypothetical protein
VYGVSYSYNDDKTLKATLARRWNDTAWLANWRYSFEYNRDKEITEERSESYINGAWVPSLHYAYSYVSNTTLVKEARFEQFVNGGWEVFYHELYKYGVNNKVISKTMAYWDKNINDWNQESAQLYSYNINDKVANIISTQRDNNKPLDTVWSNLFTYNVHDQVTSSSISIWNKDKKAFEVIDGSPKRKWYYEPYDPSIPKKETEIQLYPVPAGKQLHFSVSFDKPEDFVISIVSIDGRVLLQKKDRATRGYKHTFDTGRFAQGNYLFVLTTASKKICKTICIAGND